MWKSVYRSSEHDPYYEIKQIKMVMIMNWWSHEKSCRIPNIQHRLREGSWSLARHCPLCCRRPRSSALWDKQLSGPMSAAVYSQLMTKMGLYSIVWGCLHSKYRLGTHKQLCVDVYTIYHYIHYVSVNAKYHVENNMENNQTGVKGPICNDFSYKDYVEFKHSMIFIFI